MNIVKPQQVLIVDDNEIVRETLAHWLRREGHDGITAATGMRAFLLLRDFGRTIDWLYARAALPGPDAYHDRHAGRPVILAGAAAALSPQGDIVLSHPTPRAVLDALSRAFARETAQTLVAEPSDARAAA
jgi:hypothetical protein